MTAAIAYCGAPPEPGELLSRFNLDPALIVCLLAAALLHVSWAARNRRHPRLALAGWIVVAAALVSPLCALSVSLFAARVGQHMLLMLIAAPLLAMALPPAPGERSLWASAAAFFAALWFWHMPLPYATTFESSPVYWTMHLTLFGSALWLWRALLSPGRVASALVAGTLSSMQMGLLGALLTLASRPLFAPHLLTTEAWGFSPLADQQLGGLLMWVPGGLLFLWAALRSLTSLWRAIDA